MTTPVPLGAPDYARGTPWSDQLFVAEVGQPGNNSVTKGPFYIGNIRALWSNILMAGDNGNIAIGWFSDAAGVNLVGQNVVDLINGKLLRHSMRPFTPYVGFTFQSNLGGAFTYTLRVGSLADIPLTLTSTGITEQISQTGIAIGIGANIVHIAGSLLIGKVLWNAFASGGPWVAELQRVDRNGVVHVLDAIDQTCQIGTMRPAYVTSGDIRIQIFNLSGAPINSNAYLQSEAIA